MIPPGGSTGFASARMSSATIFTQTPGEFVDRNPERKQKSPGLSPRALVAVNFQLRESVGRGHTRAQCAGRAGVHFGSTIGAVSRAAGDFFRRVQLDVNLQVVEADGVAVDFLVFQRPLVDRRVNLAEVV